MRGRVVLVVAQGRVQLILLDACQGIDAGGCADAVDVAVSRSSSKASSASPQTLPLDGLGCSPAAITTSYLIGSHLLRRAGRRTGGGPEAPEDGEGGGDCGEPSTP